MKYQEIEKNYKALANRRRIAIIHFLCKENRVTVNNISDEINLSFKSTSRHLQVLKAIGMIDSEQVGLEQYYYLANRGNLFIKHLLAFV
ncbi:winged helix-turn-helix domain-containing protein [Patescibacteria group bacterium]|nr:winged helix-turn-helix domain-containing protein [Patescibacteria group bacterium]MBU4116095.1 winged helix-turn-helix domain-containing protein [Patescibacteria group bacterium]